MILTPEAFSMEQGNMVYFYTTFEFLHKTNSIFSYQNWTVLSLFFFMSGREIESSILTGNGAIVLISWNGWCC